MRFEPLADGKATQIRVEMRYTPPAGSLGATIARLFGNDADRKIEEDLQRFKTLMEGPAAPTVSGVAGSGVAGAQATSGAAPPGNAASQGGVHTL